jgi:hypothetical protein
VLTAGHFEVSDGAIASPSASFVNGDEFSSLEFVHTGGAPEADGAVDIRYTPSGDRLLILTPTSGNLWVLDPVTLETLSVVDVGTHARAFGVGENVAVVAHLQTQTALIVDLTTYETRLVFGVGRRPIRVEVHPDGHLAYLSYEIASRCFIVDLVTGTVRAWIPGFAAYLTHSTDNARRLHHSGHFTVTRDALINIRPAPNTWRVMFFDPETGVAEDSIQLPTGSLLHHALTADGQSLMLVSPFSGSRIYRIDLETRSLAAQFDLLSDHSAFTYGPGLAPDVAGKRVLLPVTVMGSGIVRNAIADFDTGALEFLEPTVNWRVDWRSGVHDGSHAVVGGWTPLVYDFATRTVQPFVVPYNWSTIGAVSPRDDGFVTVTMPRGERLLRYDLDGSLLVDRVLGEEPERDYPVDAVMLPDGRHALLSLNISRHLAWFDTETREVTQTLSVPFSPAALALNSEGSVAMVASRFEIPLRIAAVDLTTGASLGEAPIPDAIHPADRVRDVFFADGGRVYVVAQQNTWQYETLQYIWTGSALTYDGTLGFRAPAAALSPDRTRLLAVDAILGDVVLLDAASGSEIARAPTPGTPHAVAYSHDGTRAAVASRVTPAFTMYSVTASTVTELFTVPTVVDPSVVEFDPTDSFVAVGAGILEPSNTGGALAVHDAATGAMAGTPMPTRVPVVDVAAFPDGSVVGVATGLVLDGLGLTEYHDVYHNTARFSLPGWAEDLLVLPSGTDVLVPASEGDVLGILDLLAVPTEPPPETGAELRLGLPAPNPTTGLVHIPLHRPLGQEVTAEILDALGRRIAALNVAPDASAIAWDGRDESGRAVRAGLYLLRVRAAGQQAIAPVTIVPGPLPQ